MANRLIPPLQRIYSVSELLTMAPPLWLIDQLITEGAMVGLYGPPGEGKSFLALDWALSVAHGERWLDIPVAQGTILYVAAEGGRGLGRRIQAWMHAHDVASSASALFLLEGVQLRDPVDVLRLTRGLEERGLSPLLIVFDTFARCFVGGEENSAKDMGEFIEGVETIRRTTGAAVVVVHHTAKQRKRGSYLERGSSALRAAADVMIEVSKDDGGTISVTNTKQKDAEEFATIKLRLKQVPVSDPHGNTTTSCVLAAAANLATDGEPSLSPELRRTLNALPTGEVTRKEWSQQTGIPDRTLDSHREQLVAGGYVRRIKQGVYELTAKGVAVARTAATATILQQADLTRGSVDAAATATPPLGVAEAAGSARLAARSVVEEPKGKEVIHEAVICRSGSEDREGTSGEGIAGDEQGATYVEVVERSSRDDGAVGSELAK